MYKNEQEWEKAIKQDDLQATVEMLQRTSLPRVPSSDKLSQIRRELLTSSQNQQSQRSLLQLNRAVGAIAGLALLALIVSFFWLSQSNQTASTNAPSDETDAITNPIEENEAEVEAATEIPTVVEPTPGGNDTSAEGVASETEETVEATAVIPADQVWWLAIRRKLMEQNSTLTPYEIEVGYKLETVETATAQVFLAPQQWETAVDLYPFSDPVTISPDDNKITFELTKDLDQFLQEIPPRANTLVIALSAPDAEPDNEFLATASWKNFVDTEYFAGPLPVRPRSDSSLNVFDWEFDNNFFAIESPPRRFGGTEVVTFVANYHYKLTQTPRAYVKLVLMDTTNNRPLDSAFVRADAGTGLVTVYLDFDPARVDSLTNLAIESFIVREELLSPNGTIGGWTYVPDE